MKNNYRVFCMTLLLSFCVMYAVMFLNVDKITHIYLSTTRFYMVLLMVCPMALIMLLFMPEMYRNKKLNGGIITCTVVVFLLALSLLRTQTFIGDRDYIKAMIPHHSSAILTSKNADLKDPEVKELAESIIESQEREIKQMQQLLQRMDK